MVISELSLRMSVCLVLPTLRSRRHGSTPRVGVRWVEQRFHHQELLGRIGRSSGKCCFSACAISFVRKGIRLTCTCSALSEIIGQPLPYDDVLTLRDRMWDISPTLVRYDVLEPPSSSIINTGLQQLSSAKTSTPSSTSFRKPISDFYRTDPISRASVTMAACSKAFVKEDYPIKDIDEGKGAQASYA